MEGRYRRFPKFFKPSSEIKISCEIDNVDIFQNTDLFYEIIAYSK